MVKRNCEADITSAQGCEDYFQFLVREGIIQDRRGDCSASSSTWIPARQGMSLDEHSRTMNMFERMREAGTISADMHEALKRRYPESLIDHSLHEAVDYLMRWTDSAALDEKPALAASGRPAPSQRGSSNTTASKKRARTHVAAKATATEDGPQGGASSSEDPREAGHSTYPSGPATSTGAGKTNKRRHNK